MRTLTLKLTQEQMVELHRKLHRALETFQDAEVYEVQVKSITDHPREKQFITRSVPFASLPVGAVFFQHSKTYGWHPFTKVEPVPFGDAGRPCAGCGTSEWNADNSTNTVHFCPNIIVEHFNPPAKR